MSGLARAAPVSVAFLALSGCIYVGDFGDGGRFKEDFHKSFTLDSGGSVTIENFNGSIEILGWDQNSVEVNGTKYASTRELLDSLEVEMNGSPTSVRIRTNRPEIHFGNAGVRYALRVPRKVLLDRIASSNGSIRIEDIQGNANLRSSNGRIRISRVTGNVEAETSNGMIEVRDLEGNANLHTSNGAIDAEASKGAFDAHTSNGRIEARLQDPASGRPVRLESSNGHIELRVDGRLLPDVRARTSNSSLTIFLPPDINARVQARTTHGSVTSDFDGLRHEGGRHEQDLDGSIGSGGPLIELESTNGAIKVLRR
jgi:DUF4097 and DUF4098 domain-containing protein YvlB